MKRITDENERQAIINAVFTPLHRDPESQSINRRQYEEDLQRRQKEHLESVGNNQDQNWQPCLHNGCPECVGTGVKRDGSACVHMISCPCPKCSPTC